MSRRGQGRATGLLRGDVHASTSASSLSIKHVSSRSSEDVVARKHDLRTPSAQAPRMTSSNTRVDEIFKRMQPHTIVQAYDKTWDSLGLHVDFVVNAEELVARVADRGPISAKWTAQQEAAAATGSSRVQHRTHPFHYARSLQYVPSHAGLTLDVLKSLDVSVTTPGTSPVSASLWQAKAPLSKKSWRFVAQTDRKIGLALYELSLGPWGASSLVALVWTQRLEVVQFHLQLSVPELLYCCPPRPIRFLLDDIDKTHGLHSYTVAVTIRDFERVHWETECYSVEFTYPVTVSVEETVARTELLDGTNGFRDPGRFMKTAPAIAVATDAITVAVEAAVVVDVVVWDATCNPVWVASRPVVVTRKDMPPGADDFSMSSAGEKRELVEMVYRDDTTANSVIIQVVRPSGAATKHKKGFVKQITLEFGISFINATFGTNYPRLTKQ